MSPKAEAEQCLRAIAQSTPLKIEGDWSPHEEKFISIDIHTGFGEIVNIQSGRTGGLLITKRPV